MNPRGAEEAMGLYRAGFRPSPGRPEPYAILAVSAVCADDGERARELAMSLALGVVRMRAGRPGPLPTPEEALAHDYSPHEQEQVRRYMRAQVLGDPAEVAEQIRALAEATGADEVMVMTSVHDHGARLESYERIAAALGAGRPVTTEARRMAGLGDPATDAEREGYYRRRERMLCGAWLACASIAVPDCWRIWFLVNSIISWAMSASRMRDSAAWTFSAVRPRRLMVCSRRFWMAPRFARRS